MIPVTERFLQTLRRTQFMPPVRLLEYQRGLLERLIRHAQEHVPFYRDSDRLRPLFTPSGTISWERWNEIPRITRRELQQNFEALKADTLTPEHGGVQTAMTSGTTGEPVTVVHSDLFSKPLFAALMLRDLERHRIDPNKHLAHLSAYLPEDFEQGRAGRHDQWYWGFSDLGYRGMRTDFSDMLPARELVDRIAALKPDYLRVQPAALELMTAHDSSSMLARSGLAGLICVGEDFEGDERNEIERQLGCSIVQVYSSTECGRMATTCAECGRYHVHAETTYLEIVSDDGIPTAPGDTGSVLVTPLYNYAMPLIRYDHADEAIPGETGRCSVQLPALGAIHGKRRTPFVFPDGTAIRPTLPASIVVNLLGADAFQFVQVAPDRCEIRFVQGSTPREHMRFDEMTAFLRRTWWPHLHVDYCPVERLPTRLPRSKPLRSLVEFDEP
jgi:phenylacetate-CoA ligase